MSSSKQQTAHTGVDPQFFPSYFVGLLRRLLPPIRKDDLRIKQIVGLTEIKANPLNFQRNKFRRVLPRSDSRYFGYPHWSAQTNKVYCQLKSQR